ncbi:MAG: amidohydrolase family protein [Emcibacter sp.]|nr:amidohydrolase family protein [Emcibacter sp.]
MRYFIKPVILVFFLLTACAPAEPDTVSLMIVNVSVINPVDGKILKNKDVIISAGKISAIRPHSVKYTPDATLLDGTGKFLVPGLIDGHVHTGTIAGLSFAQSEKYPELTKAYFAQQPRSFLYFGFTTVVDLNGNQESFDRFEKEEIHPDLFNCGQALILEDGYPAVFVPREVRQYVFPNQLYDPRIKNHTPGITQKRNTVKNAVQKIKDNGGICVKTFHEDGFSKSIWPVPTAEMLARIRAESTRQNLPLLIHANSYDSTRAAVIAGADAVAHGLWNWDQFADEKQLPRELMGVLDQMITRNVAQMGSLQTIAGLRDLFDDSYLNRPQVATVLPPAYLDQLKRPEGNWYRDDLISGYPTNMNDDDIVRRLDNVLSHGQQAQKYFYDHGGRVLFGSDTPSGPLATNIPGYNGYLELSRMADTGLSLPDILKSATITNARFFGLDKQYGTVEVGKLANLLLMSKNPLETIEAYDAIDQIILHGQVIDRASLKAK